MKAVGEKNQRVSTPLSLLYMVTDSLSLQSVASTTNQGSLTSLRTSPLTIQIAKEALIVIIMLLDREKALQLVTLSLPVQPLFHPQQQLWRLSKRRNEMRTKFSPIIILINRRYEEGF
jgi:hypothetical protein